MDRCKGFHLLVALKTISDEYRKYQWKSIRIHDNRHLNVEPLPTTALPIQLFHPVFRFFSNKAFNPCYDVPDEIIHLTKDFMYWTAPIYPNCYDLRK